MQQQSADLLIENIRSHGGVAVAEEMDLADFNNIPRVFDLCETDLGGVDVLINNHTLCVLETFDPSLITNESGGARLVTAAGIDAHFAVNARAYALLMAEYLQRYLNRGAVSQDGFHRSQLRRLHLPRHLDVLGNLKILRM